MLARLWYGEDGSASALTRSLASAPDVMETLMPFLGAIMGESSLDLATKELVIVRVSQLNGCRYCLAAHRPVAVEAGVPREHVEAICDAAPLDRLPPRERAIVAWVDQVTLDARERPTTSSRGRWTTSARTSSSSSRCLPGRSRC